ncbi:AAA family ATPase [Bacillus sp. FJAT-29953]|nr:AAA family ATPase [Bacillus sp. FJAT-29953]
MPYKRVTIEGYIDALSRVCSEDNLNLACNDLFTIDSFDEFISIVKTIKDSPDYKRLNRKYGKNQLSAAIAKYTEFMKSRNAAIITTKGKEIEPEITQNKQLPQNNYKPYTKQDFLAEVFINEESYDTILSVLKRKKNLILQGAPGVGKTFAAKRLAYSMMGKKDESRIKMIQFHQSYSYEDFVMGYRPNGSGFELKEGPFFTFCQLASKHPEDDYFFIIDEINRGNMSKIFGELMMLIESDKRGQELTLTYQETPFSVPNNLFIIGMMNTADRSLAMIDYALRRRFSFIELEPAFQAEAFRNCLMAQGASEELVNIIRRKIEKLNDEILNDVNLGKGFRIGHSYFCDYEESEKWYEEVIKYEIEPLVKEYWFDEEDKAKNYIEELLR